MKDILNDTKGWFELAVAEPTEDSMRVQLGVHIEEVAEMFDAIAMPEGWLLETIGTALKTGNYNLNKRYTEVNRKELLDSLCDQIVTAVGVAHMYGLDIEEGMRRVNASNYSKFVDGKPIFNDHGKITKGPDYKKPDLEGLY